jgi:glucose-6-phosphate isomerase
MAVEALQYYSNHLQVHFVDGDHVVNEVIKKLDPETTLLSLFLKHLQLKKL